MHASGKITRSNTRMHIFVRYASVPCIDNRTELKSSSKSVVAPVHNEYTQLVSLLLCCLASCIAYIIILTRHKCINKYYAHVPQMRHCHNTVYTPEMYVRLFVLRLLPLPFIIIVVQTCRFFFCLLFGRMHFKFVMLHMRSLSTEKKTCISNERRKQIVINTSSAVRIVVGAIRFTHQKFSDIQMHYLADCFLVDGLYRVKL